MKAVQHLLVAAACAAWAATSSAQIVYNGSFEIPQLSAGIAEYAPPNAGWTWTGAGIMSPPGFVPSNGGYFRPPAAPSGSQLGFMQGAGSSMSQIIALPAYGIYTISYYDAGRSANSGGGGNTTYEVLLDTNVIAEASTVSGQPFGSQTRTFTSTAGSHTLMFEVVSTTSGSDTAFFDAIDVELTQSFSPEILSQPANAVGYWGESVAFQVAADGIVPLSYQWYIDGSPISWGTKSTLLFTNLALTNAGQYSVQVQVTNVFGSVLSSNATLIVNPAGVSLGLYAGLTLTGAVGKTFGIQYSTNLAVTNSWTTITNITLAQPVQLWVDTSVNVSGGTARYYRVVAVP